jgi:uncharacterized membrane protein YukC
MSLSKADQETLEENWGTAREEVARHLPNVAAANLGNTVRPEHIAMLSGQDQDRVDEVLGEVAKNIKKDEKERKEGKSDKPVEHQAVDNAHDARVAAQKADEEKAKETREADEKGKADLIAQRTAGIRQTP